MGRKTTATKQLRHEKEKHLTYTLWMWEDLRVPGTTVTIALLPGFVEVRDRGLVKKKIKVRNRSFEEVYEDLLIYFKSRGKILPPGVIEDSLVTIGVPRAKKIIAEEKEEAPQPEVEPEPQKDPEPIEVEEEEPDEDTEQVSLKPGTVTVIEDDDLPDIEDALTAVESLSDSFMSPVSEGKQNSVAPSKPQIRITLKGTNEVVASDASTATDPNKTVPRKETPREPEKLIEELEEMIDKTEVTSEAADIEEPDSIEEFYETDEIEIESAIEDMEEEIEESDAEVEVEIQPREKRIPNHAVKPLVSTKVVILGEDGVGKHSLLEKAGLKVQTGPEIDGDPKEYIQSAIFRLEDYRVDLDVWSFDDAVNAKISRKEFYDETSVIIIVYSVSDRWSFESIDFWLREATVKQQVPLPIILVGNKKDIRDSGDPDPLEPAVTSDEGFRLAESLAKKLGTGDKLHQVAFIETSCLTGEGAEDVFRTASEFYVNSL